MKHTLIALITVASIYSCQKSQPNPTDQLNFTMTKIADNGGRVSWYQGQAHSKVLFDRVTNALSANTDVFMMEPDGSNVECLTCDITEITNRFVGQPVWHPDGIHCIIQVENANSSHTRYEHVSFGLNNDLWLLNTQTKTAEKMISSLLNGAALHPQFNPSGDKLMYSRRIATGVVIPALVGVTPGGENHWSGWNIEIRDFDMSASGPAKVGGGGLFRPNGNGFYETHSIDQNIVYSFTPNGLGYVDDCYSTDLNFQNQINITQNPNRWEEHLTYSPSKNHFIFISSRHDTGWEYPQSDTRTISTELFMKNPICGAPKQLTQFNSTQPEFRTLTSDFDWSSDGKSVIFLAAKIHRTNIILSTNEIWRLDFERAK